MSTRSGPMLRRAAGAKFATPVTGRMITPKSNIGDDSNVSDAAHGVSAAINTIPFVKPALTPECQLVTPTVEDYDLLWDWARSDREGVSSFMNQSHANSQSFFQQLGAIGTAEQTGAAWLRAVRFKDELAGFVMLNPILKQGATLHLYLTPSTPTDLIASIVQMLPTDLTLMLVSTSEEFANHFTSLGFTSSIVLTRPATSGAGHDRV